MSQNLSWNHHIDKTAKKGYSTLGFLRRNLRVSKEDIKGTAYKTLVRANREYCSTVWNPFTKDQVRKLEMVQRRAARYVTNRYHQHQQRLFNAFNARSPRMGITRIPTDKGATDHDVQDHQRICGHPSQPECHPSTGTHQIISRHEIQTTLYSYILLRELVLSTDYHGMEQPACRRGRSS